MRISGHILASDGQQRIVQHLLFWGIAVVAITIIYGTGLPSYLFTLGIVLFCIPIQMLYFYVVACFAFPKLLYQGRYICFFCMLLGCMLFSALLFRLTEILIVDPMIFSIMRKNDPSFVWHKLDGTFIEQLKKANYFILAIEQTNIVVWVAIAVKFFKMWYEKRQTALQSELDFLKSQVNPHFLFNTLNNLYALTLTASPRAPTVVLGLSQILRYMLYECNSQQVLLKRDIEVLENYIAIEKLRYEDRLHLNVSISGTITAQRVAPLLLLTLVQNAFKHGASEDIGEPWIHIEIRVKDRFLKLKVANSKPDHLPPAETEKEQRKGIGTNNIRKRLEINYTNAYQFRIMDEASTYIAVLEIDLNRFIHI